MLGFAGWSMPLHYRSQVEEHHAVRREAGIFDVSHMTVIDLNGSMARELLRTLVVTDVDRLQRQGMAFYTCMLNELGGVIDDLIVYRLAAEQFRVVSNAATRTAVMSSINSHALAHAVEVVERRDLAMIAVQGPRARALTLKVLDREIRAAVQALEHFTAYSDDTIFVARTGYTGEDGLEIIVKAERGPDLWNALLREGVVPAGLGARDTLRLEAGMNLHGADMDEGTSLLECGLGWTVSWAPAGRSFVGREALERQRHDGIRQVRTGLILCAPGVLRAGQKVELLCGSGLVTSGGFSPTLGRSVALVRLPAAAAGEVRVEIRGRWLPARVVDPPFVRNGRSRVSVEDAAFALRSNLRSGAE